MGRPKVRPEDRRRAPLACVSCQTSKKRCDSRVPCATCVHRRQPHRCVYAESSRRRQMVDVLGGRRARDAAAAPAPPSTAGPLSAAGENQSQSQSLQQEMDRGKEGARDGTAAVHTPSATSASPSSAEETVRSFPSPESRMLRSSKGEPLFIGETASLSFLQFLRHTLRRYMGPSAFTDNGEVDRMLEVELGEQQQQEGGGEGGQGEEKVEFRRELIGCYFGATCGIINVYTEEELYPLLEDNAGSAPGLTTADTAALHLALAIGRQVSAASDVEAKAASLHFFKARQIAFQGMLMDPTVDMVRVFLMMAFFLLGACRRNGASMYLGVASKAATSLGLHEMVRQSNPGAYMGDVRYRTWQSLRVLETIVTAILGRHSSVPPMPIPSPPPHSGEDMPDINHRHMALDATFMATAYIDDFAQKLSSSKTLNSAAADQILQQLRQWSASLRPELRRFPAAQVLSPLPEEQESAVGNIHVACVYYFSVILITRPFLIQHLSVSLQSQAGGGGGPDQKRRHPNQSVHQLAQACIESAVYMAQVCFRASESGLLFNNMCLLKAFIFVAGLVLGFSLFVQDDSEHEKESAFNCARHVLEFLARSSPQAQHYSQILSSFSEAIVRHRQQLKEERRRTKTQYVDRILDFEAGEGAEQQQQQFPFIPSLDSVGQLPPLSPSTANALSDETMAGIGAEFEVPEVALNFQWDEPTPRSNSLYSDQFPLACEAFEKIWDGLI